MNNHSIVNWIRIEGNGTMPAREQMVLLFMQSGRPQYQIGYWGGERFLNPQGKIFDDKPSHWMTLPNPPDNQD